MPQRIPLILPVLVALLAAGCSALQPATPTPTPELVAETRPVVSATGKVVPAEWTVLSFPLAGDVVEVAVEVGSEVEAGDLIARLDTATLEAEVSEAEAALAEAEANLDKVRAGASEEEIRAAERVLAAAYAETAAAAARRDALYEAVNEAELVEANNRLYEAQREYERARSDLEFMENFDPNVCRNFWNDDRECPLSQWGPIQEYFELAQLRVEAAQALVNELQRGPDAERVKSENARIQVASAEAAAAKARLDLLRARPFPEEVQVAQAEVAQAQAGVEAARARLAQAELFAPFAGTVTEVNVDAGEYVGAGEPVVQIGDLTGLRVETTDLNEIDVARVKVGDTVIVTFDALPDIEVSGTVVSIAPKAEEGTGVNYTVVIEMDELPAAIRWGMTAFVDIEIE